MTSINKISKYIKSASEPDNSFDTFYTNISESQTRLETFAINMFRYQYQLDGVDLFIHRFNELKSIGFDISSDIPLINPETPVNDKINYFVKTKYVPVRISREYIENMYITINTLSDLVRDKDKAKAIVSMFNDIFGRCTHKGAVTDVDNILLFMLGVDINVLCAPDNTKCCDEKNDVGTPN